MILSFLFFALAFQETRPAEIVAETTTLEIDAKETARFYRARPKGGSRAALVVVHEWWGMNDQIRSVADRLAREGFDAAVPDLYGGKVGEDAESAHTLMRGLDEERAVRILRAAVARLRGEGKDAKRVGMIGFCMGGRLAMLTALEEPNLSAAVACYGRPETRAERLRTLRCPLLCIFGGADEGIGSEQVEALRAGLREAEKEAEIEVYEKAAHAFMNEKGRNFDAAAAAKAWIRALAFLRKNLSG